MNKKYAVVGLLILLFFAHGCERRARYRRFIEKYTGNDKLAGRELIVDVWEYNATHFFKLKDEVSVNKYLIDRGYSRDEIYYAQCLGRTLQ